MNQEQIEQELNNVLSDLTNYDGWDHDEELNWLALQESIQKALLYIKSK